MADASTVAWILFGGLGLLILVRVPLGFALAIATAAAYAYTGDSFVSLAQSFYDSVDSFPLVAVPMFFLAGTVMESGGISRRLVGVAEAVIGNVRGGLGMVSVLASMFFSAISGSGPATTAAVGGVMVPAMLKRKYPAPLAAAVVATGGTLGVLIPPSILMILYGVIADQSISELFLAALLPGLFVGFFLMLATYVICRFYGIEGTGEAFNWRLMVQKLWWAKLSLMVPVIILGGIYAGVFTATESAVIAAFYGIFISMFVYREMDWKQLRNAVYSSAKMTGKLGILWGVSVAFGEVMTMYQIPTMLSGYLLGITSDPTCILLIISAFLIFTGCFMNSMSQVIIFTPIYLPIIMAAGINPIHFCMVFVMNAEIGFLTPPLGTTLFVAMEQAGVSLGEISKAVLPFIGAYLLSTLVIILFPWLSLVLPKTFM